MIKLEKYLYGFVIYNHDIINERKFTHEFSKILQDFVESNFRLTNILLSPSF